MKGIVFRLLESFVVDTAGADAWESIYDAAPLSSREPWVGPGTYPDADFMALAVTASDALGVPLPDAVRQFGRFCLPRLLATVPSLTSSYTHPRDLLLALDGTIHAEVRKLWKDASPPSFACEEGASADALVLHYTSQRGLCAFVEGLLDGASKHYRVPIRFEHTHCVHRGDARCTFQLAFDEAAERAA